jgi:predicted amidohydrolase
MNNHSYPVIKAAIADDFLPDIISSDLTATSAFGDMVFGLPVVMSKYLALGLPLEETVRGCTAAPAAALGMAGKIGTLAPGAIADVAILRQRDKERRLHNRIGETMVVPKLLVPVLTILDGKVAFRQVDFC